MHCIGLNQITAMHFALYGTISDARIYRIFEDFSASDDPDAYIVGLAICEHPSALIHDPYTKFFLQDGIFSYTSYLHRII